MMDNPDVQTIGSHHGTFPLDEAARIATRLENHHPPEHAGWSDLAETGIRVMALQCLGRRIPDLKAEVWTRWRNWEGAAVGWSLTAGDARARLKPL